MRNVFLFLIGFSTACNKSDTTTDLSKFDILFKIQIVTGDMIYVSPIDNSINVEWAPFETNITALPDIATVEAANMDFGGETNTTTIVTQLGTNKGTTYAAKLCADLVAYGFDDWYLPAAGELNEMFNKLGPVASGGSGQITTGFYWSSSENSVNHAWMQNFGDGNQYRYGKFLSHIQCRCIRR